MIQLNPSIAPLLIRSVLTAFAVSMLAACASSPATGRQSARAAETDHDEDEDDFDTRLSKLKIGMSRSQVIAIMGDNYYPGARSQSAQGSFETLMYQPGFGSRYATALIRGYSFGIAGRKRTNGTALQIKDGRLSNITQF